MSDLPYKQIWNETNNPFREFTSLVDKLTINIEQNPVTSFVAIDCLVHLVAKACMPHMKTFQKNVNMNKYAYEQFNGLMINLVATKFEEYLRYEQEKE